MGMDEVCRLWGAFTMYTRYNNLRAVIYNFDETSVVLELGPQHEVVVMRVNRGGRVELLSRWPRGEGLRDAFHERRP
jgi:hypothetical protein